MTVRLIVAALLGLAVLLSIIRLVLWHRASAGGSALPRLIALILLQPVCAILLFLGLFPPLHGGGEARLRVATASAPRLPTADQDAPLVILPEAGSLDGQSVPDLATALRRYPSVRAIDVLGQGLTPRDIEAARPLGIRFNPAPARNGISALTLPGDVAPGSDFRLAGTVAAPAGARVELVDPAGRVTDATVPDRDGQFVLAGTARAAGPTLFSVRLLVGKRPVETATVPLVVRDHPAPRLLILAGAPGPEVKYLRRWASDSGFDVVSQISAGGGVMLGDQPIALNGATLGRFDAVLIDDRAWNALGAQRGALLGAVHSGLGLILRSNGALDATTRSQWQALGFPLPANGDLRPITLPKPIAAPILRTRQGIAPADMPDDLRLPDDVAPEVSRIPFAAVRASTVPMFNDAAGAPLALWRAAGTGRIVLFAGVDSYALPLTSNGLLYDQWWRTMLSVAARPIKTAPALSETYWVGERLTLCELDGRAKIKAPDGSVAQLQATSGCAGYWPVASGWHQLQDGRGGTPFFVQPSDALPALRAARDRNATLLLAHGDKTVPGHSERHPGPSWPWLAAWLAASAFLWWLERSRLGRPQPARSSM